MIYSYPDYYKKFRCIADKCPDTCCSDWQIVIDDESLEKYRNYAGEYRQTLHRNIQWEEGVFGHNRKGKCAFLRDDGLCDMYKHMGKDSLCTTCREYPRHTEEFENIREISLSLSCPEVARILLQKTEPVTFVCEEDDEEEVFEDYDYFLFSNLEDIREEILKITQNREESLEARIEKVLQIGASAQRHYEEGDLIAWDECEDTDKVCVKDEYELFRKHMRFLSEELELLYQDWDDVLVESEVLLFDQGEAGFTENKKRFLSWWEDSSLPPLEIVLEQIVIYFISIYLLGAVYDGNILGKIDSAVGHVTVIFLLLLARWIKCSEKLEMADLIELVYRYSREIEHSDENLDRVEELDWFIRI